MGPIAKSTIRTSLMLGLRLVVQAGTLLLVARMLGASTFGVFAGLSALAVLLGALSTFGTHWVLLGEASKDPGRQEEVFRYALPLTLSVGCVVLLIYVLIATLLFRAVDAPLVVLLTIGVAEAILQPLVLLLSTEQMALGRVARSQLLMNIPMVFRLLAAIAVFLLQPINPLVWFGYGYFAASLIALIGMLVPTFGTLPALSTWRWPRPAELKNVSNHAVLALTAGGPTELDKALAVRLLSSTDSGLYSAASRIVASITLPVVALVLSALPRVFRENLEQIDRTKRLTRLILASVFSYGLILALALYLFAPYVSWLFGGEYAGMEYVLYWLCLALPGVGMRIACGSILMAVGKPWLRASCEIFGLASLVVASVLLTYYLGAIGMPLAFAISEWAMACFGGGLIFMVLKRSS